MGKRRQGVRKRDSDSTEPRGSRGSPETGRENRLRLWLIGSAVALVAIALAVGLPLRLVHIQAVRAIQDQRYQAAESWLARASLVSSRSPRTELLAARLARRQGRASDLSRHLSRAATLGADPDAIRTEELLALAQSGQLEGIERELVARLAQPGAEADEISDAYANGLAAVSRFDDAIQVLEAWRADYPKDPRPLYRLGRMMEHRERWEQAATLHRQAFQRSATFYPAAFRLGRVLYIQRQMDEALVQFTHCLKMPNPLAAEIEMASCLRAQGESERAVAILEEVLTHDYAEISQSYRAVDENLESHKAATDLGNMELDRGEYVKAEHWLRAALAEHPRDLVARYSLAIALRQQGRTEEAAEHFEHVRVSRTALEDANRLRNAIAANPEDLDARLQLGKILLTHDSQSMGLFWVRSILTYDPDHAAAHETLAEYYSERKSGAAEYARLAAYHQQAARRASNPSP